MSPMCLLTYSLIQTFIDHQLPQIGYLLTHFSIRKATYPVGSSISFTNEESNILIDLQ